jgi:hypothetical protein
MTRQRILARNRTLIWQAEFRQTVVAIKAFAAFTDLQTVATMRLSSRQTPNHP